eukprot:gene644-211_t
MLKIFVGYLVATAAVAINLKSDDNGINMGDINPQAGGRDNYLLLSDTSNPATTGEAESTAPSQPAAPHANEMDDRESRCEAPDCSESCKLFMDYVACGPCFLTHSLHPKIKERWLSELYENEPGGWGIARLTLMKNGKMVERDPNETPGPARARKKFPSMCFTSIVCCPCWARYTLEYTCRHKDGFPDEDDHEWLS